MDEEDFEFVQRFTHYPKDVLKSQNGKTVPLTLGSGGQVLGEATLIYVEEDETLEVRFRLSDPKVADLLRGDTLHIFKKES